MISSCTVLTAAMHTLVSTVSEKSSLLWFPGARAGTWAANTEQAEPCRQLLPFPAVKEAAEKEAPCSPLSKSPVNKGALTALSSRG